MSLFSRAWKILTEDPSKDISKAEIKEPVPNIEKYNTTSKPDVKKVDVPTSLIGSLMNLKNMTYMSSDVSIKDVRSDRISNYGYGAGGFDRRNKYSVLLELSGRTLFERLVPDFGLSEINTMGRTGTLDYTSGIIRVENYDLKVIKANIWVSVWDETDEYKGSSGFYRSKIESIEVDRETLTGEVRKRVITIPDVNSHSFILKNVIFNYNDTIKEAIVNDLFKEVNIFEKNNELAKIVKSFDSINFEILSDLFACIGDDIGLHKLNIEKIKQSGNFNYFSRGIDDFWNIKIDVSDFKNNNSTYSLNGNLSNVMIEIGESMERVKKICDISNIEMSFSGNYIILTIRPIYPHWLTISPKTSGVNPFSMNRHNDNYTSEYFN